ncbi:MAG: SRPBCC family protein [Myxococcota bacterium]
MSVVVTETVRIACPAPEVFAIVSEPHRQAAYVPEVQSVEYLDGEGFAGIGTRVRETRRQAGSTLVTDLEVVEYDPDAGIVRMVADTHGTIWDTRMVVVPDGEDSRVTFTMDARGSTWSKRLVNRLMRGFFRRGIRGHLETLRTALARP